MHDSCHAEPIIFLLIKLPVTSTANRWCFCYWAKDNMDKIKVFTRIINIKGKEKLHCLCKHSNPRCEDTSKCETEEMYYDKYQDFKECFLNKGRHKL